MKTLHKQALLALLAVAAAAPSQAKIEGSLDPDCVVAEWSNASTYPKVIDINFSDELWPGQTWQGETGMDCPEMTAEDNGGYVNTVVNVPANGGTDVTYRSTTARSPTRRLTTDSPEPRRPSPASIT